MCLARVSVRAIALVGVAGLVACASPAKLARPAVISLGDATMAVPPRWDVEQRAERVTFTDPDRALHVTVVANAGPDAATAIAAAWQLAAPGFALAPGEPDELPDSGDWDAVTTIEYKPPTSAHRTAIARWRKAGTQHVVVLVDGDSAAVERREADIKVLEGSLRVPGMREQTLGARHPLDARQLDGFVQRALTELEVPGAARGDQARVLREASPEGAARRLAGPRLGGAAGRHVSRPCAR